MDEKKKELLKKAAAVAVSLFAIFYVSYQVYLVSFDKVETVTAVEKTVNNSLFATAFFVREEEYIINPAQGTVVPVAQDGKKVSGGNTVAVAFDNDESVNTYMKIQSLRQELERYTKLNSITPSSGVDARGLDSTINDAVSELVDSIELGNNEDIDDCYATLRDSITKKQLIQGTDINFTGIIDSINSELEALERKNISYETVDASGSGYYIATVDGYENAFDYSQTADILPEQVDALLNSEKADVPEDVMGKLVTGFNWYIVCKFDIEEISELKIGSYVTVDFPYSSTQPLKAEVAAVNVSGADTAAVVLRCNVMDEELANMRIEDIEIIFNSVTGYRVPSEAVREVDGVKGVYILRSNSVTFREINIVWASDEYVVCKDDEVRLYDEIITKGKDLYDGKAIN